MGAWGMKGRRGGRMDGSEGQPVYLGFLIPKEKSQVLCIKV